MKRKVVKELLEKHREVIVNNVRYGQDPKSSGFISSLIKRLRKTKIPVPQEGYMGKIGVYDTRLPNSEDIKEMTAILDEELDKIILEAKKDRTIMTITETTIKALIANKLDSLGVCYSIRDVSNLIAVVVTLKQQFHIEFLLKMGPDIVEKIDNIPTSIIKANELIELNGTSFVLLNRHYGESL